MPTKPVKKPSPGDKKSTQVKSPAPKKQKEIIYSKILVVQQQYRQGEVKQAEDQVDETDRPVPPIDADPEDDQIEEKNEEEEVKEPEQEVDEYVEEKHEEEQEGDDDRGEENHEEYEESVQDEQEESLELYDPKLIRELQVNSKNKASSLKKLILESIGLSTKKAQINLYKQVQNTNPENGEALSWEKFTDQDYDQQVKIYQDTLIAFRVYMAISVAIEGRGQSYKCNIIVDPMEPLQTSLKNKTHFWKTFMMRGHQKCLVMVMNKNEEDIIVAPDCFTKTFKEVGVQHGSDIVLHEFKNLDMSDDEGGEDEHEEMEDEQEEDNEDESKPAAEAVDEDEQNKKASEVLFEHEGDSKPGDSK
jgi:hypothetical protein